MKNKKNTTTKKYICTEHKTINYILNNQEKIFFEIKNDLKEIKENITNVKEKIAFLRAKTSIITIIATTLATALSSLILFLRDKF